MILFLIWLVLVIYILFTLDKNKYDLDHLIQTNKQDVIGPIQDDEALLLYSIVKGMRLNRVLEIGGL